VTREQAISQQLQHWKTHNTTSEVADTVKALRGRNLLFSSVQSGGVESETAVSNDNAARVRHVTHMHLTNS